MASSDSLNFGDLLERPRRRGNGEPPWDQEVTCIAIGDVFDLTGFGHVGDVFLEQDLHGMRPPTTILEHVF
jgi:hypothetical protein